MVGLNPDKSSFGNVFDIILDESLSDSEYVPRTNRRVSRKYTRQIFKEPGSKIIQNNIEVKDDHQQYRTVFYTRRLEYIVGKPIERYEFNNGDNPVTLRSRLVQNMSRYNKEEKLSYKQHSYSDPYVGSSFATVNDIDILEAKTLRRKIHPSKAGEGDLNLLRQEINKIVSSSLDARDPKVSRMFYNSSSPIADDEEREGYEGCTSHGCVNFLEDGVGPGIQDLISDVKEYWIR